MKKLIVLAVTLVFSLTTWSQEPDRKVVKDGNHLDMISYYENGQINEIGTFTLAGKLEGHWKKYDKSGNVLVSGDYAEGKKTGLWLFWKGNTLTEVTFVNNKSEKVTQWTKADYLASH